MIRSSSPASGHLPGRAARLCVLTLLAVAACGDSDEGAVADTLGADTVAVDTVSVDTASPDTEPADSDGGAVDADTAGDDTSAGPVDLVVARRGARMWGPPIQLSLVDRQLWIGTRGNPAPLDLETIRAGLFRVDLDTGAVRVFEDELPHDTYYVVGVDERSGPVPTAGVHRDGERLVVVAFDGLLGLDDAGVTPLSITPAGGEPVTPIHLGIARDGLRPVAWMTSDAGLLRLDEDTFAVETVIPGPGGMSGQYGKLAIDPDTGDVYAGFYPDDGNATRVVRATVAGDVDVLVSGEGDVPEGVVGDLVWSSVDGAVYVALASWSGPQGGVVRWDGEGAPEVIAVEAQLAEASSGEAGPFGAASLALDDTHRVLAVGGQILGNPVGPTQGGGLAFVDLTGQDRFAGVRAGDTPFVGLHVTSLVIDPTTRRTYAAVSGLCSSARLRTGGVVAFSFDEEGAVRVERPFISGVRDAVRYGGELLVGLRDDFPGLACQTYPVQVGLARPLSNGAAELVRVEATAGGAISPAPAITDLAADGEDNLIISTWRDGIFHGPPAAGAAENPTTWRASLFLEDVAATVDGAKRHLWLTSRAVHHSGDPASLADVGPHGAVRVALGDKAGFGAVTHFVAASNRAEDVKGLPSSDVRAVLPDPDVGGAVWLGCARERLDSSSYDRAEEEAFVDDDGAERPGGVARVTADDTVSTVVAASDAPDVRALARLPGGDLLVADAEVGLLRVTDEGAVSAFDPAGPIPAGAVPVALWTRADGGIALATDRGALVELPGANPIFIDGVGHTWAVVPDGDRLLIATDEGLVVVTPPGAAPLSLPAPGAGAAPPFEVITPPGSGGGECLTQGSSCQSDADGCCPGLSCVASGFVPTCE